MSIWVDKNLLLLKVVVPLVFCFVLGLFLYFKFIDYKAAILAKQEIIERELRERNIDLDKAQVDIIKIVKINDTILTNLQKEWIKDRKLDIAQYQQLLLLYQTQQSGQGTSNITVKPDSIVVVDDQIVKNWKLNYSDFRINIEADVLSKKFDYMLHQRFNVAITKAINERGVGAYFANVSEIDNTGKSIGEVRVKEFTVKETKPTTQKFRWFGAPLQLGVGVAGTVGKIDPQILVAYPILTRGYTTVDTSFAIGPYIGTNGEIYSGGIWAGYDVGTAININLLRGIKCGLFGGMSNNGMTMGIGISK